MHLPLRLVAASITVFLLGSAVADAAVGPVRKARLGTRYVLQRQVDNGSLPGFSAVGSTADGVLALVAAKRGPRGIARSLGYLAEHAADAPLGQKAKVVMAVVAAGSDPRSFGGRDLVADVVATRQPDGQYAEDGDCCAVVTHALAMLALAAAGETQPATVDQWLVAAQCPDGGWQYDRPHQEDEDEHCQATPEPPGADFASSDSNTTAYAVQALAATPAKIEPAADPFTYFASARDRRKRGYRYSHQRILFGARSYTDANSTALVLQAFVAAGRDVPAGARRALGALQYPRRCGKTRGAFAYTWSRSEDGSLRRSPSRKEAALASDVSALGATIAAVPGLLLKAFPLPPTEVTRRVPRARRC